MPPAPAGLERTLDLFRKTHPPHVLEHSGNRWEYACGGSGTPPIAILGGGGSTAESMFSVHAALERRNRTLSIAVPASAASLEAIAGGIEAVLDELGIGQAVLLGHSFGGMVAQAFALDHANRVAALILSHTGIYRGARALVLPRVARVMALLPARVVERAAISQMNRLLRESESRQFWSGFLQAELKSSTARLTHQLRMMAPLMKFLAARPAAAGARFPVQIISAEDDRGFNSRETAFLASRYPGAIMTVLPRGAGHLSFLTRPGQYLDIVQKFIDGPVHAR